VTIQAEEAESIRLNLRESDRKTQASLRVIIQTMIFRFD